MATRPSRAHAPSKSRLPARKKYKPQESLIKRYRTKLLIAVFGGGIIALIVAVFVFSGSSQQTTSTTSADASLVQAVTSVPAATFDSVGAGTATTPPVAIQADPLTSGGKPELLYIGGEFCPYCAAERWPMVMALSRFGTFNDLKTTRSASGDAYPNTATFSFYGSSYTSDYLSFVPVEKYSNVQTSSGYAPLQKTTDAQEKLLQSYTKGGVPFLDFGGKYLLSGSNYNPATLGGMDWNTIVGHLGDTNSAQAKGIIGSANLLTATICTMTNGQPGSVCNSAGVQKAASLLK